MWLLVEMAVNQTHPELELGEQQPFRLEDSGIGVVGVASFHREMVQVGSIAGLKVVMTVSVAVMVGLCCSSSGALGQAVGIGICFLELVVLEELCLGNHLHVPLLV